MIYAVMFVSWFVGALCFFRVSDPCLRDGWTGETVRAAFGLFSVRLLDCFSPPTEYTFGFTAAACFATVAAALASSLVNVRGARR